MSELDPLGLRQADGDRSSVVAFTFEGRRLLGVEGEPIAAALHAQGVRVLGRSMKHRRPRGLHCVADACPSCAMRVNGLPGVNTCSAPLRAGDVVGRQRGVPSADHDAFGVMDGLSRFAPIGFQYRRFRRSPRLFERWERVLARLAGSGVIADERAARALAERSRWSTGAADVAVIGGGAAGLAAAVAAARAGARVLLVERRDLVGGQARVSGDAGERARVAELERLVRAEPAIELLTGATALGWYAEDVLAVAVGDGMLELRARAVVLATGAHERPLAFADNDRPGVMLGGGVERLLRAHAVRAGRRVVVATTGDHGYALAAGLVADGMQLAAVVDRRPSAGDGAQAAAATLRAAGVELHADATVAAALGRSAVTGARIAAAGGRSADVACDTIAVANGRRPARELLLQRASAGGLALHVPAAVRQAVDDPARPVVDGWWLAGGVGGTETLEAAARAGEAAGRAAAEGVA